MNDLLPERKSYPQLGGITSAEVLDSETQRLIKDWTLTIGEATEEELAQDEFPKTWDEYKGTSKYLSPDSIGYTCIEVLSFLKGRRLDNVALNYIHSVRPSRIRIVPENGCMTSDAVTWRVTVHTEKPNRLSLDNKTPIIKHIKQEVEVGCVGFQHGHDLSCALEE